MSIFEDTFQASALEVLAPHESVGLPEVGDDDASAWFTRLQEGEMDRRVAFFDENLTMLLLLRFADSALKSSDAAEATETPPAPPKHLIAFLVHLQVSYEASYISPNTPVTSPSTPLPSTPGADPIRPPLPPRSLTVPVQGSGAGRGKPTHLTVQPPAQPQHPSIFPPSTPLPVPSANEADKKYVQAQGVVLYNGVWGEDLLGAKPSAPDKEAFRLLWDAETREWVAVYKTCILVAFMPMKFLDPLLSLTVSITLRDRPLASTPPRQGLTSLIDAAGGLESLMDEVLPGASGREVGKSEGEGSSSNLADLEEINLLEGLKLDPTFQSNDYPLYLPSTRLGPKTRAEAFALPSKSLPPPPDPISASTPRIVTTATLRRSFRKIMSTATGFRVRMRTVFVPYFLLPKTSKPSVNGKVPNGDTANSDSDSDLDALEARDQLEAGNEEHTVVLSVEVENVFAERSHMSATPSYEYAVEDVVISVGGTGARTALVPWGTEGDKVFPIHMGPSEQVNLLYAVTFLRGPEIDQLLLAEAAGTADATSAARLERELRRSVTINIHGHPFERKKKSDDDGAEVLSYPTPVYPSRWNCVLDLAPRPNSLPAGIDAPHLSAVPTPASAFPALPTPGLPSGAPPRRSSLQPIPISAGPSRASTPAIAGSKRFTISGDASSTSQLSDPRAQLYARMPRTPVNYNSPTSMLNPANQPQAFATPSYPGTPSQPTSNPFDRRGSFIPPSIAFEGTFPRSPTTYGPPASLGSPQPPPHVPSPLSLSTLRPPPVPEDAEPRTPAYPAYTGSPPPVPPTPFWQGPLQQQGAGVGPSVEIKRQRQDGPVPPTPGPRVGGFTLPPSVSQAMGGGTGGMGQDGAKAQGEPVVVSVGLLPSSGSKKRALGEIYPLDEFTLDIFVFNQSSWTRRFEVSYPEERRRRRRGKGKSEGDAPGILPLENRVRIGPLLPSTCQSVRMQFLALTSGVHSIEALTLTDVRTGFTMHLRSVMDIVVLEPEVEQQGPS